MNADPPPSAGPSGARIVSGPHRPSDGFEPMPAELALQESKKYLQPIIDGSPHALFIKDLRGRYVQFNPAFAQFLGLTREQIIDHTNEEIFPLEEAAAFRASDLNALVAARGVDIEVTLNREGGRHTYSIHKFPLRDNLGNIYAIFGFVTDITDRKRAEEALQLSEEKFRQLADNISEVLWITDPAKDCDFGDHSGSIHFSRNLARIRGQR